MNVSYRFCAVFALTEIPSTRAGLARSAAGSPASLRLHRPKAARHASYRGSSPAQARPGANDWA
jgi:hypothetical protein